MISTAEPLLPVGKDCDCGHPLVWRHGAVWCAVYGSHPTPPLSHRRDRSAPLARVVDELAAMSCPAQRSIAARARRERLRLVRGIAG